MTRRPNSSEARASSGKRAPKRRGKAPAEVPPLTKREAADFVEALIGHTTPEQVDDLRFRLAIAAAHYQQRIAGRGSPSPSAIRKQLEAIKRPALRVLTKLAAATHIDSVANVPSRLPRVLRLALLPAGNRHAATKGGYPDLPPRKATIPGVEGEFWDYRAADKVASIVEGIQTLVAWCDEAIAFSRKETGTAMARRVARNGRPGGQARHEGDLAVNEVIFHLAGLYRDLSGREPGISRPHGNSGDPGGPFVRFVLRVCERLKIPMTPASLEKRWRAVRRLGHTSDHAKNNLDPTNSA